MKKQKFLFTNIMIMIMYLFILSTITTIPVFAVDTSKVDPISGAIIDSTDSTQTDTENGIQTGIKTVTMEEIKKIIKKKGDELVSVMQTGAKPFSYLVFIICGIILLVSAFTKIGIGKGILGMIVVVLAYNGILYAPQIVEFFSTWLIS